MDAPKSWFLIQLCTRGLNHGGKWDKSIKCLRIETDEAKISLFADHVCLHGIPQREFGSQQDTKSRNENQLYF